MPGAGHMRAANWLYNVAPRDGTVWGSVSRNIPAVGLQQLSGVQYDPLKFNWIGSPELTNRGCMAMAKNPRVKSAADLFEHELVVGGTGAGSTVTETPKLLRGLLGMKFRVVDGYAKPQDGQFAMERGELDGMCATVQSLRNFRPDWFRSGTARVLFTLEQEPVPWTERADHLPVRQDRRAAQDAGIFLVQHRIRPAAAAAAGGAARARRTPAPRLRGDGERSGRSARRRKSSAWRLRCAPASSSRR